MQDGPPPHDRLTALGNHLVEIHVELREEFAQLRDEIDAFAHGGDRPRDLRRHCLAFCGALHGHHTREDGGMFPALAAQFPDLRPAIEQLEHDHGLIAGLLRSIEGVVEGLPESPDRDDVDRVLLELDGLGAIMESHFRYEERTLVDVLNGLGTPPPDRRGTTGPPG